MRSGIVFPLLVMALVGMLTLAMGCGASSPSGGSESGGGSSEGAASASDPGTLATETEAMGFIPSSKAGDHVGAENVTVRGIVKDYQWISGRPGRPHLLLFDTGALIARGSSISEQEIPDTFTVQIWKEDALKPENFPESTNFAPIYLDKVVCVTGTIEKDWDDRPSIRATHSDQLKADC